VGPKHGSWVENVLAVELLALESAVLTLGNWWCSRIYEMCDVVSANGISVLGASDTTTGGLDDNRGDAYAT